MPDKRVLNLNEKKDPNRAAGAGKGGRNERERKTTPLLFSGAYTAPSTGSGT